MSDPEYIKRFAKAVYPDSTELCMSMATEESMLTDAAEKIEQLQARVEELEKSTTVLCCELKDQQNEIVRVTEQLAEQFRTGHHITEAQIDAAVKRLYDLKEEQQMQGWWMLNELDIHRCEGCGGRARGWIDNDPDAEGSYEAVCPDCIGKGWVKR